MKIAIVFFPIIEPGGINTYIKNLRDAWWRAGHTVNLYYATATGRLRTLSSTQDVLSGRYVRLAGEQVAYGTKEGRQAARRILSHHDLVVFGHQCPHPNIRGEGDRAWQGLYNMDVPKFAVWHDNIWNKNYPWFEEVADQVHAHLYTNPRIAEDSGAKYPGYFVYTPHPIDVRVSGLFGEKKRDRIVWLPQWKTWKGIKQFAEACQYLKHETFLYNSGIEYYYSRRDAPWWQKSFGQDEWDDKVPVHGNPKVTIKGPVIPQKVPGILKRASISVDLLGFSGGHSEGQHSYVQVESMVYGAVPFVHQNCSLPIEVCYPTDDMRPKYIAKKLNLLMKDKQLLHMIAKRGLEFVSETYDADRVAAGILKILDRPQIYKSYSRAHIGKSV